MFKVYTTDRFEQEYKFRVSGYDLGTKLYVKVDSQGNLSLDAVDAHEFTYEKEAKYFIEYHNLKKFYVESTKGNLDEITETPVIVAPTDEVKAPVAQPKPTGRGKKAKEVVVEPPPATVVETTANEVKSDDMSDSVDTSTDPLVEGTV